MIGKWVSRYSCIKFFVMQLKKKHINSTVSLFQFKTHGYLNKDVSVMWYRRENHDHESRCSCSLLGNGVVSDWW